MFVHQLRIGAFSYSPHSFHKANFHVKVLQTWGNIVWHVRFFSSDWWVFDSADSESQQLSHVGVLNLLFMFVKHMCKCKYKRFFGPSKAILYNCSGPPGCQCLDTGFNLRGFVTWMNCRILFLNSILSQVVGWIPLPNTNIRPSKQYSCLYILYYIYTQYI